MRENVVKWYYDQWYYVNRRIFLVALVAREARRQAAIQRKNDETWQDVSPSLYEDLLHLIMSDRVE